VDGNTFSGYRSSSLHVGPARVEFFASCICVYIWSIALVCVCVYIYIYTHTCAIDIYIYTHTHTHTHTHIYKGGEKQWQPTPKNLPRMQCARAIPVA